MLILIIIFILGTPSFSALSAPSPSKPTSGLTYPKLNTTVTGDYAAILASGEKIFIPSAEEIVPSAYTSQLPPQYSARRAIRSPGIRCDTSSTSALHPDAQLVAVRISGVGSSWCCQTTSGASACTRMGSYLTAEINICGPRDRCIMCGLVAMIAGEIVLGCRRAFQTGDRTGGRFWYDQQIEIVVDHSYKGVRVN